MSDVTINRREDLENGYCAPCEMPKLKRDGVLICPNCDTDSVPSGLTNTHVQDPGTAGYKQVKIKGTDGKEYVTWVPNADENESQENPEAVTALPQLPVMLSQKQAIGVGVVVRQNPETLVNALREQVKLIPVETMNDFKKRKKVIDQIDKLEFLIQQIKGA